MFLNFRKSPENVGKVFKNALTVLGEKNWKLMESFQKCSEIFGSYQILVVGMHVSRDVFVSLYF